MKERLVELLRHYSDEYTDPVEEIADAILDLFTVSDMLQWCYNYVNKQKDSDEKQRLIEELKKMGCL